MCPLGAVKALHAAALHDGAGARAWRVRLAARFSNRTSEIVQPARMRAAVITKRASAASSARASMDVCPVRHSGKFPNEPVAPLRAGRQCKPLWLLKMCSMSKCFPVCPRKRTYLPILELLPPPALRERHHRGLARRLVAVRWRAVLALAKGQRPHPRRAFFGWMDDFASKILRTSSVRVSEYKISGLWPHASPSLSFRCHRRLARAAPSFCHLSPIIGSDPAKRPESAKPPP